MLWVKILQNGVFEMIDFFFILANLELPYYLK